MSTYIQMQSGLFSSNSNVIWTRRTCCQRSSMVAGTKRRALAVDFSVRICYMSLISNCRGESNLGLCNSLKLAKRMRLCSADFQFQKLFAARFVGSRHCAAVISMQVPNSCTDLDRTFLYISIWRTHIKFVRKTKTPALGVCFLLPCPSAGCSFAASRWRVDYYRTVGVLGLYSNMHKPDQMNLFMCICMYVQVCRCTYICVCMFDMYLYIYTCGYIFVYTYLRTSANLHVCMNMPLHIYIFIHIYTFTCTQIRGLPKLSGLFFKRELFLWASFANDICIELPGPVLSF